MNVAFFAAGAWAFGGGFVSDDTAPTASGGTVVLAWDGTNTTLTFAPITSGGTGAFALIVPLPSNPGPDAVRTVSADSVASALAFTAPRLVAYTCEDLHPFGQDTGYYYYGGYYGYEGEYIETVERTYNGPFRWNSGRGGLFCGPQGCGSQWYGPYGYWTYDGQPPPPDTGVDTGTEGGSGEIVAIVEPGPSWSATYDAAIVAADTRADVDLWFADRSLVPTAAQDAAIDTYLGAGRAFLLAAVTGTGEGALPPLQVTLAGRAEDVAVRLGQLQSPGAQDLVVLALDATSQRQEVADWEKVAIADSCMLDVDDAAEFAASYQEAFAGSLEPLPADTDADTDAAGAFAAWAVEFDGNGADCDPCAGELTTAELTDLGVGREPMDVHLTRLHLRYSADAPVQDVHLTSAPDDAMTLAYVQYDRLLEADFPVCGEGFVEDPRSCPQNRSSRQPREPRWPRGVALGGLVLGVGLWLRRRARR